MFGFGKRKLRLSAGPESLAYAESASAPSTPRSFKESIKKLSVEELELAYRSSGVIFKGINKKARDAIRKGFWIEPDVEDREDAEELNAQAREWMRRVAYKPKAIEALREMFVFSQGFLELGYADKAPSDSEPAKSAVPLAVYNVPYNAILPVKDEAGVVAFYLTGQDVRNLPDSVVEASKKGVLPSGVKRVHPKRIQHFEVNSILGKPISVIEAAYVNLLAKLAGDLSAGDILEWYSKGFFTVNVEYGTPEELAEIRKLLDAAKRARQNHFVGTERSKFDIKSPANPNITQFYDNFYLEIAAALEMPSMVLLGVQKGTVTGSGTDLVEYYDEVHAFQSLLLEAPFLEMMRRVLKRDDISLDFVQLYVDKQTEADVAFKRAQAATQLYGARVLTRAEAVRFMRDGDLPNPDDLEDTYAVADSAVAASEAAAPEAEGDEGAEESAKLSAEAGPEAAVVVPLSDEDRARIEAHRKLGLDIIAAGGAA